MHTRVDRPVQASAAHGRFVTLDAMRGVAALAVVCLHTAHWLGGYEPPHAQLAVDAFFVLSGFVLALRYDPDFASGRHNTLSFMRVRAIRLGPVYLFGFALGCIAQLVNRDPGLSGSRLTLAAVVNLADIPAIGIVKGDHSFFPLNNPFWSLFFEFWVANLAYAAFWKRLKGPALMALIGVGAAGLAAATVCNNSIGMGYTPYTLPIGFARVTYSFFVGVALARLYVRRHPPITTPAAVLLIMAGITFCEPLTGLAARWATLASVLFIFPALTYFGARASYMPAKLGATIGDASYAAYAVHFPLIILLQLALNRMAHGHDHARSVEIAFVGLVFVLSVILARYDVRLRKHLYFKRPIASRLTQPV